MIGRCRLTPSASCCIVGVRTLAPTHQINVIPSLSRDLDAFLQRVEIPQLRFAPFGMTGIWSDSAEQMRPSSAPAYEYRDGSRSRHVGLPVATSVTFFSRRHALSCFSRAMASRAVGYASTRTRRSMWYRAV